MINFQLRKLDKMISWKRPMSQVKLFLRQMSRWELAPLSLSPAHLPLSLPGSCGEAGLTLPVLYNVYKLLQC